MSPPNLEDLQRVSPAAFEEVVKKVFDGLGYNAAVTGRSGDGGVDLVLQKGDERSIAQCKRYKGQVGQSVVREFYGTVVHEKADRGYLVTTGTFSLPAQTWAQGKNVILIDGVDLISSIDTLELQVALPAVAEAAPDDIEQLGQALRDARDGKAYLRLAFLGPPPKSGAYKPLGAVVAHLLEKEYFFGPAGSTFGQFEACLGLLRRDEVAFWDGIDDDPKALRAFIQAVHSPESYVTRFEKRMRADVHLLCSLWDTSKLQRLSMRHRLMFTEAFPVQVPSRLVDWSDVEGWVGKLLKTPTAAGD